MEDDWDEIRTPSPTGSDSRFTTISLDDGYRNVVLAGSSIISTELVLNVAQRIVSFFDRKDLSALLFVSKAWSRAAASVLWYNLEPSTIAKLRTIVDALSDPRASHPYAYFIHFLKMDKLGQDIKDEELLPFKACANLECLRLPRAKLLTNASLLQVIPELPYLTALSFDDMPHITDETLFLLPNTLSWLSLRGCRSLSDLAIQALVERSQSLTSVFFAKSSHLTNRSIMAMVNRFPLLSRVEISQCWHITDPAIHHLWTHSSCLRHVVITNNFSLTDFAFTGRQPPTEGVDLDVEKVADVPTLPIIFAGMRYIDLTSCVMLSDDAIDAIADGCPALRTFILDKCSRLTDKALSSVAKIGKYLHKISLSHLVLITDDGILVLVEKCKRLRFVEIGSCPLLTDKSIAALATLPKLWRFGCAHKLNITDDSINALAQHRWSTLRRVHLSYCHNLTLEAISKLVQSCTKLEMISLSGILAFVKPEFQKLCKKPPKELSDVQSARFCVWSGDGVKAFRQQLAAVADPSPPQSPISVSLSDWDDVRPDSPAPEVDPSNYIVTASGTPNLLPPNAVNRIAFFADSKDLTSLLVLNTKWSLAVAARLYHTIEISTVEKAQSVARSLVGLDSYHPYASFVRRLRFKGKHLKDNDILPFRFCMDTISLHLMGTVSVDSEHTWSVLLAAFPGLTSLLVENVPTFGNDALSAVPRYLQRLRVRGCQKVAEEGLLRIAGNCSFRIVEVRDIAGMTDEVIGMIVKHSPQLTEMELTSCPAISEASIRLLWTGVTTLRTLKVKNNDIDSVTDACFTGPEEEVMMPSLSGSRMRELDLTGSVNITDAAVEAIVSSCPKLRRLVLNGCSALTDVSLGHIGKIGRCLGELDLTNVVNVTDIAIIQLIGDCKFFRTLDLSGCPLLTDAAIKSLAFLPRLEKLGLSGNPNITNEAIGALAKLRGQTLQDVRFAYCPKISPWAFHHLLDHCTKINRIDMSGNPLFMKPEYQGLCVTPPPNLNVDSDQWCIWTGPGVSALRDRLDEEIAGAPVASDVSTAEAFVEI